MSRIKTTAIEPARHARWPSQVSGRFGKRRVPGRPSATTRASTYTAAELAPEEASFLRWLCANGGKGTRSGKNWMRNDARLVKLGYVKAYKDGSKQPIVRYTLSLSGSRALARYDSANHSNPFAINPWPKRNSEASDQRPDTDVHTN
jgi:hypothetical protein